jgi:dUTP pyrophosphatase
MVLAQSILTTEVKLVIKDGERIAQGVVAKYEQVTFEERSELSVTERGAGGYGSTGRD